MMISFIMISSEAHGFMVQQGEETATSGWPLEPETLFSHLTSLAEATGSCSADQREQRQSRQINGRASTAKAMLILTVTLRYATKMDRTCVGNINGMNIWVMCEKLSGRPTLWCATSASWFIAAVKAGAVPVPVQGVQPDANARWSLLYCSLHSAEWLTFFKETYGERKKFWRRL